MLKLLALFLLIPIVELALLIEIGRRIGTIATLGLIVLTGMLGASLAYHQGFGTLRRMQAEVAEGRIPAGSLIDGLLILVAGAVLLTPGILTDALGFLCLVPFTRGIIKKILRWLLIRAARKGEVHVSFQFGGTVHPSSSRRPSEERDRLPSGSRTSEPHDLIDGE